MNGNSKRLTKFYEIKKDRGNQSSLKLLEPKNPRILEPSSKGFTLIEMVVVIVILSIISVISIYFLINSAKIYTMTINQKTLFDEGKLVLERMCRDIRDASNITSPAGGASGSAITFTRTNATAQDSASETITFQLSGTALQKVKNAPTGPTSAMAGNVSTFTVTRGASNEVQLQLSLSLGTGEKMTLQTKVYPKNFADDLTLTYKNFFANWQELSS
jgi:prepilin-type N-terminal cleavage/methylation domain-containing protein